MTASPNRARDLFLAAARLAPDRWDTFLLAECAGDAALRERVRDLLAAHQEAGSFLEPAAGPPTAADDPAPERPGIMIGRYKLLEQIGEGGFGVVFLAEQTEPVRRRVALKVLKPGMDSRQVVARFEAERQALALMDHPNIAHVFDAGTTPSGRPYFVMELVKGVPITKYCDDHRLTPKERLNLFVPVCQAVQHAHQKGVIHRDLKPSNVLVSRHDTTPVVKVIDFGVAKALGEELTDKTLFTGFAQLVGTPLYMSPEQAGMSDLDVDTRSDIYALGVLLYELLTGTTPFPREQFRRAGYDEIRRIIREEDPPKPSTRLSTLGPAALTVSADRASEPRKLSGLVRGELDWIVMRCLEKDRARRYETADGLARDIQRYLADEPVEASPPGAGYRLRKFVKRNKGRVAAAGLVLAALVAGMAGTTWGLVRADGARRDAVAAQAAETERAAGEQRAREEAQQRLAQVEAGTEILASVFRDLNPITAELAGVTPHDLLARRLSEAARQLEGEAVGDPLVVARLQHLLGISLRELGHPEQAVEVLVKAGRTRERLLGADDLDSVATKHHLAAAYRGQRRYDLAEALFNEVLASRTAQLGADHLDTLATKHHLAWLYKSQEKYALAEPLCTEVVASRTRTLGPDHLETLASKHLLGVLYKIQGKVEPAEAVLRDVVAGRTARLKADHLDIASSRQHLAELYWSQRKHALAEELFEKVVAVRTARQGADHLATLAIQDLLAKVYEDQGKYALAEPLYKKSLEIRTAKQGADHPDTILPRDGLANSYVSLKQSDQSIPLLEKSLQLRMAVLDPDHWEILARRVTLGSALCDAGRFAEGLPLIEEVRQKGRTEPRPAWVRSLLLTAYTQAGKTTEATALVMERVRDVRAEVAANTPQFAAALADNGKALLDVKAYAAAEPLLRESLSLGEKKASEAWDIHQARSLLGAALLGQEKYAKAEPLLVEGYEGMKERAAKTPTAEQGDLTTALERVVQLYEAWDKQDQADEWRKKLEAHKAKQPGAKRQESEKKPN